MRKGQEVDSFVAAYFNIAKDLESVEYFKEIFTFPYYYLVDSSPTITTKMPLSIPKNTESTVVSEVFHWNKFYKGVTEWYIDGELYSNEVSLTYKPTKRSKRSIEVEQYVGSVIGDNRVDRNKSHTYKKWTLAVDDTYPVNATGLISSALITDIDQVTFNVQTGFRTPLNIYTLCDTYNKYAITVDSTTAPTVFPYECDTAPEQPAQTITMAKLTEFIKSIYGDRMTLLMWR